MTVNASDALRNAKLDQEIVIIPAGSIVRIRAGTKPVSADTARVPDGGGAEILSKITLPAAYVGAASGGVISGQSLPWTDASADATGTAAYYEIMDSGESTCFKQGDVPGDMTVTPTDITAGQEVSITAYTVTAGNA